MPLPRLLAKVNKRVFNPREVKKDRWVVLTHWGRTSGKEYETPLAAHRDGDSSLIVLMYGTESDWVRNVFAAGGAKLRDKDEEFELGAPRLVPEDEFWSRMPEDWKPPPSFMNVHDFIELDIAA